MADERKDDELKPKAGEEAPKRRRSRAARKPAEEKGPSAGKPADGSAEGSPHEETVPLGERQ